MLGFHHVIFHLRYYLFVLMLKNQMDRTTSSRFYAGSHELIPDPASWIQPLFCSSIPMFPSGKRGYHVIGTYFLIGSQIISGHPTMHPADDSERKKSAYRLIILFGIVAMLADVVFEGV